MAYATMPVTCGVAMEVPEMLLTMFGPPIHAEMTFSPGAKRSTQVPVLLNVLICEIALDFVRIKVNLFDLLLQSFQWSLL